MAWPPASTEYVQPHSDSPARDPELGMQLYGCGFNAHMQLAQLNGDHHGMDASKHPDWKVFYPLGGIDGFRDGRVLFAGWSSTVVLTESKLYLLGLCDKRKGTFSIDLRHHGLEASDVRSVTGDVNGPLLLLTWTGALYTFARHGLSVGLSRKGDDTGPTLSHVAITATGRTAVIFLQARGSKMIHVLEFETYQAFEAWFADPSSASAEGADTSYKHFMLRGKARTLLAGATAFILLTDEGEVFSWGDGRHARCLGRTPDADNPSDRPGLVDALGGIRVDSICGCGWMFGALSADKDVYMWGRGKPGQDECLGSSILGSAGEEVKLLDCEHCEDIESFAVGNGHILISDGKGQVYAIGENHNSQLGLGPESAAFVDKWASSLADVGSSGLPTKRFFGEDEFYKRENKALELFAGDATSFVTAK